MDIRNLTANQLREQAASKAKADNDEATRASSTSSRGAGDDTVQLSRDAAALQEIQLQVNVEPFDQSRVDSIRQAIAEGRYHVDPERLAANFTRLESDLIQ